MSFIEPDKEHVEELMSQLNERLERLEQQKVELIETEQEIGKDAEEQKELKVIRALSAIRTRIHNLEETINDLKDVVQRLMKIFSPKDIGKEIVQS